MNFQNALTMCAFDQEGVAIESKAEALNYVIDKARLPNLNRAIVVRGGCDGR